MAKPRKPKIDEAKPGSSGALIRHQKLCLSIDIEKQQIYGYTELEIIVPEIGIVGLFAENLVIENVFVEGEPTEFEYYPRQFGGERWLSSVTCRNSAADVAGSVYVTALEKELVPNLLINCCKGFRNGVNEAQENVVSENGVQNYGEDKQNVKLVRINYWVEKAETGIQFSGNVLHTDNQIRRARCWFPCIDEGSQCCRYDLEFTVPHNLVAVSAGSLLYQVLNKDDPHRKTYVYRLDVPVTSRWIALVVAPFEILPDPYVGLITHICLPAYVSLVRNTVEFFHNAFNHYEEYLEAKFPFGSYTQVFLAPEMVVSSLSLGASISVFSSQILYDERVIDQAIDTSVKLAFALAKQWFGVYITAEEPSDGKMFGDDLSYGLFRLNNCLEKIARCLLSEWLLDGLAGFLTDSFIKRFLGNNEARYRRYKANCAVCKADDSGATALSSSASCKDLYGTHCMGLYGKIRSWKSVAILQMLEKQMGPESFRKILQKVVSRAGDVNPVRTLSTKEFRHFTTKVGNLERPFVKEFFPRWVCSCGCPVLRMGFSYNKKKNMVELAVLRECTATPDASALVQNLDSENRDGDGGWPGMMSIRVYELDGMYDHPVLPLAGDMWQLLEIQCHTKLAARRFQKPKRGSKLDGSEENGDVVPAADARSSLESPLSWVRADPEMEYLAEIHFNQPLQMWINQLEKDEDVVAQAQAITALEALPQLSFSVVNALNNFLSDSKAFWRVRIEAAFALANTASEETDWAGLLHLIKFYKSRRFDATIGLPKPNDFHDFPEYFVLEAIPHAVAMVRASDRRSPREAVEFVLQLLKYNDNTGNPYSDVFWLAALVQSAGELEFGPQSVLFLSSLLKRIDRLLQFDRLMPSYNGILTVSCIRTLAHIAIKLSESVHIDHVCELITPFRDTKTIWQVRNEASRALLDLEFHCRGIDAALLLFIKYLTDEPSLRGQVKLGAHAMRLCQLRDGSVQNDDIQNTTLVALLHVLEGSIAFNNVILRHHLFCIFQILAGRPPTLYGTPRDKLLHVCDAETFEPKNIFATTAPVMDANPVEPPVPIPVSPQNILVEPEIPKEPDTIFNNDEHRMDLTALENNKEIAMIPTNLGQKVDLTTAAEVSKEADTISNNQERKKPVVKIRVRQSAASSRAEEADNQTLERSQGRPYEIDRGATSSVSVDAPQRNSTAEAASISNQNLDEDSSGLDRGSRMTASIGSAKLASDDDNIRKELRCTADSSVVSAHQQPESEHPSSFAGVSDNNVDADAQKFTSLQSLSFGKVDAEGGSLGTMTSSFNEKDKAKKKKKDKEKKKNKEDRKRHRDDPEYLERKRLKKEKKRKEKELAKLLSDETKRPAEGTSSKKEEHGTNMATAVWKPDDIPLSKPEMADVEPKHEQGESRGGGTSVNNVKSKPQAAQGSSVPRFRIKIKSKTLNK